jgi:hypothetical protein
LAYFLDHLAVVDININGGSIPRANTGIECAGIFIAPEGDGVDVNVDILPRF